MNKDWLDEESRSEAEYQYKKTILYLRTKSQELRRIQHIASDIHESALFNLTNIRLNSLQDEIEKFESLLDLELRKNKLGLSVIRGDKR